MRGGSQFESNKDQFSINSATDGLEKRAICTQVHAKDLCFWPLRASMIL